MNDMINYHTMNHNWIIIEVATNKQERPSVIAQGCKSMESVSNGSLHFTAYYRATESDHTEK